MLFTVGRQWLELVQPDDAAGEAGRQLAAFGESPFELVLTTGGAAEPGDGELLPADALHGARIRVAR